MAKNVSIERWFDKLRATWADPAATAPYKLWKTVTDPVILIIVIAIIVLIVFLIKCSRSRKCPVPGAEAITTDMPQGETSL
jgi:hypothetical protein